MQKTVTGPGRQVLPSLLLIEFNMPFYIDGVLQQSNSGIGIVVDAQLGIVLTDRHTIPASIGDVALVFANSIIVPGEILYIHQVYNFALISYDVSLLGNTVSFKAFRSFIDSKHCPLFSGKLVCESSRHINQGTAARRLG
jgi:hypothetical protein